MTDLARAPVRLAELVAALSLGIDLGFGQPMEHVLRQCVIALRLADALGLEEKERATVYYTALLINVGCHADAHEQAKWFGDDIALKSDKYDYEFRSVRGALSGLRQIGAGSPVLQRFRIGVELLAGGYRELNGMIEQHAALARKLAEQLALPSDVQDAVGSSYEQWNGKGWPGKLSGDEVPIAARISQFAEFMEVAHRVGGVGAATAMATRRAGTQFDPNVSALLCDRADEILSGLETPSWPTVIESEPSLAVRLSGDELDSAMRAIADFVDLKSPYTLGHSRAVAALAEDAATRLELPPDDVVVSKRAALVAGLGRLGVSNAIWDKAGPLGAGEWERVRMHPYLSQRMLHQSKALAPLGAVAVQLRERLDGSGYPRGISGAEISRPARVLAVADAYQSMIEPRPHRAAMTPDEAATALRRDVAGGRLDKDAVGAVLESAGHRVPRRREGPAGLTAREIDVLRLLARGMSSKEISAKLVISPKTARNHIEHIYTKIGATSRVTASWFAVQHGLLAD